MLCEKCLNEVELVINKRIKLQQSIHDRSLDLETSSKALTNVIFLKNILKTLKGG